MFSKKIVILVIILFFLLHNLYSDKINRTSSYGNIIVYPFYPVQSDFPEEFLFLSDTIPDIIKQEIIDTALFYLIEKNEIDSLKNKLKFEDDFYKMDNKRLKIAKKLKADYFSWGYFIYENDNIFVYYQLVDTKTGRTKKIDKAEYEVNPEIFNRIEVKTHEFAEWINKSLPGKYVENKTSDETTDKKLFYFNYKMKRHFEVDFSFLYTLYMIPFDDYIKNNFGGEIALKVFIPRATFLYASVSVIITLLDAQKNNISTLPILMVNIPIYFKFGANFHLVKYLEIDIAVGNGLTVFAGYLLNKFETYVRPNLTTDFNIYCTPVKYFKVGLGLVFSCTFFGYSNWNMITLAPRFSVGVSF